MQDIELVGFLLEVLLPLEELVIGGGLLELLKGDPKPEGQGEPGPPFPP